jgi:hypothetical protein
MSSQPAAFVSGWKESKLWQTLHERKGRGVDTVHAVLVRCMGECEPVLKSGATSPKDFTLHDAGHAFRVAERMFELVPNDVLDALSPAELALLVLSAYLHDIGMSPAWHKLDAHERYLTRNETDGLSERERDEFDQWLAEEDEALERLVTHGGRAAELLTYYCRKKHNDWGSGWTRKNLGDEDNRLYHGWLDDLVMICNSHHEGYDALVSARFDPHPVYVDGVQWTVHRRYLAMLLRMADILENDPERTPDVLVRHRGVAPRSQVYWKKDHFLFVTLSDDKRQLSAVATPNTALIHRALEQTIAEIDGEVKLCFRLQHDDNKVSNFGGDGEPRYPHRWDLKELRSSITPGEGYEYIDGAFRPEPARLLELLSGVALYGTELAAVRELLQNAFDAVRERIARARLRAAENGEPDPGKTLEALYGVELYYEVKEVVTDGVEETVRTLDCRDDGAGMSKAIVTDSLLASGRTRRRDVIELRRKCQARGVSWERTGTFGIGVLSYFMLAEHVRFQTRRDQETGEGDLRGWEFSTWGIGTFGELKPVGRDKPGTEVRLILKKSVVERIANTERKDESEKAKRPAARWNIGKLVARAQQEGRDGKFYANLCAYIESLLVYLPCRFTLRSSVPGCEPLSREPGWALTRDELRSSLAEALLADASSRARRSVNPIGFGDVLGTDELRVDRRKKHVQGCLSVAESAIDFRVVEGVLSDGALRYRLSVPFFNYPCGPSLAICLIGVDGATCERDGLAGPSVITLARPDPLVAWVGMRANFEELDRWLSSLPVMAHHIEIDLTSTRVASIHVNRVELSQNPADDSFKQVVSEIGRRIDALYADFLRETASSVYTWLNSRLSDCAAPSGAEPYWIFPKVPGTVEPVEWRPARFPTAVLARSWRRAEIIASNLSHSGYALLARVLRTWFGKADGDHVRLATCGANSVDVMRPLRLLPRSDSNRAWATYWAGVDLPWYPGTLPPDRLNSDHAAFALALVWEKASSADAASHIGRDWATCAFPPEWGAVLGVHFCTNSNSFQFVFNEKFLRRDAPDASLARCVMADRHVLILHDRRKHRRSVAFQDAFDAREKALEGQAAAIIWLVGALETGNDSREPLSEFWEDLASRDPEFLPQLWRLLLGGPHRAAGWSLGPLLYLGTNALVVITPSTIKRYARGSFMCRRYLPRPGPGWRLKISR